MGGRIHEPPGTPPSEVDPILRKKRKALQVSNQRTGRSKKPIPREFDYHPTPPPLGAERLAAATSYVRRRGAEHADLLLDMLGLIEPAQPAPSPELDDMGRRKQKKYKPRRPKVPAQVPASATSDKMVSAMPSA